MEGLYKQIEKPKKYSKGGARPGAGRPRGVLSKKTDDIIAKSLAEGITPLEVMLAAMHDALKISNEAAHPFAKDAAPYMHPKISNIELTGKNGKDLNLIKQFNIRLVSPDADDI